MNYCQIFQGSSIIPYSLDICTNECRVYTISDMPKLRYRGPTKDYYRTQIVSFPIHSLYKYSINCRV